MSIYLVRSLLLSLFIAILVTACYYFLREEMKSESIAKFKKSMQSWSAAFTVKASPTRFAESGKAFKDAVDKNMQATTARLKAAGITGEIKLQNDSTYSINISHITDTISIRNLVASNASMQFFEVLTLEDLVKVLSVLPREIFNFLTVAQPFKEETGRAFYPPYTGILKPQDLDTVKAFFSNLAILGKFPVYTRFMFSDIQETKDGSPGFINLYAIRKDTNALSNKYITHAVAENDFNNEPSISFQFDAAGTRRWERMTEKNVGKPIAICINDKVISAPNVIQKIEGGSCRLNLGGKMETSRILSVLLTSQDLLLPVRITTSTISAENLSPIEKLSPVMGYLAAFAAAFAISFSIIWFIFKPGKNTLTNP